MFLASSSTAPSAPVLLTYEIEQSVLKLIALETEGHKSTAAYNEDSLFALIFCTFSLPARSTR